MGPTGATGATGDTGPTGPAICFTPGTRIRTPDGERPVEDLRPGDTVVTAEGRVAPVRWVGRRPLDLAAHARPHLVQPVRIAAGAFGTDAGGRSLPARDLVVSPGHGLSCEGVLIPAGELVNGRTITRLSWASVIYLHVELDRHDLVLAEGLATESYLDCGDGARTDYEGGSTLALHPVFAHPIVAHPTFAAMAHETACAPIVVAGPAVEAARARLSARADAMEAAGTPARGWRGRFGLRRAG